MTALTTVEVDVIVNELDGGQVRREQNSRECAGNNGQAGREKRICQILNMKRAARWSHISDTAIDVLQEMVGFKNLRLFWPITLTDNWRYIRALLMRMQYLNSNQASPSYAAQLQRLLESIKLACINADSG